ncbi:quercetin dioxygenase-like cupin family protein [Rhizobium aethiopicum]|uniref:Quercetin dioxygenase-like cupin family protein n=1 Tax=Rhizobium aethiopicum TaxID=1138170 RepID=A0A7W6MF51_9HYPH|nr:MULTISPECIES: cupin domain-containing protein [Rhizobium]MBB4191560.1 quercetin dioxygenase-like cupin family protein [Rhizobium aethiopicum]MBB4578776.1 quercetin dioxygenase-like cupin family protein [Rhizobium aethiopicum]MDO3433073.1 cupin domain-containing protein [Rhizobium sp. CBN3]
MSASNPKSMTVRRPGKVTRSPEGVATAPFWVEMLLEGTDGENTAMRATLDPGTITRWHTHPKGQLLYVVAGQGLAQNEGGSVEELRAGDAVWFAPGERHWHGAADDSPLTYISIQPAENGSFVEWLDPVEARP